MVARVVDIKLERMYKEAMVVKFKIISHHSSGGTGENQQNLRQSSECSRSDSNHATPECK
jgi:hypothetical protein